MIRKILNNGTHIIHVRDYARLIELQAELEEAGCFEPQISIDVYNRGVLTVQSGLYDEESRFPLAEWGASDDLVETIQREVDRVNGKARKIK